MSSYSPLQLEQRPETKDTTRWRDAFEDLILLEREGNMPNATLRRLERSRGDHDSFGNWLLRLAERGTFQNGVEGFGVSNPHWNGISKQPGYGYSSKRTDYHSEQDRTIPERDRDEAETELDYYDRFLGPHASSGSSSSTVSESRSTADNRRFSEPQSTNNANGKPSVISTMTKTERQTLPDGTIHTRVVLKKRFADGSEENSETVHTTQASAPENSPATAKLQQDSESPQEKGITEQANKKGWFWN